MDFSIVLNKHLLEYFDDTHQYVVDGIVVPSITQMLQLKFRDKYEGVSSKTLLNAAAKGTQMHEEIEAYYQAGIDSGSEELRNFKFLTKQYGLSVKNNELPVILSVDGEPFAAGRIDLILEKDGLTGLGDLKRTAVLDREYLAYQLNLYRLAYEQSYHDEVHFLSGFHLREDKRKLAVIAIDENKAYEIINEWRNFNDHLDSIRPSD